MDKSMSCITTIASIHCTFSGFHVQHFIVEFFNLQFTLCSLLAIDTIFPAFLSTGRNGVPAKGDRVLKVRSWLRTKNASRDVGVKLEIDVEMKVGVHCVVATRLTRASRRTKNSIT